MAATGRHDVVVHTAASPNSFHGKHRGADAFRYAGEAADAFSSQSYFFSSTGGSPLSCAIGMTVLDVLRRL